MGPRLIRTQPPIVNNASNANTPPRSDLPPNLQRDIGTHNPALPPSLPSTILNGGGEVDAPARPPTRYQPPSNPHPSTGVHFISSVPTGISTVQLYKFPPSDFAPNSPATLDAPIRPPDHIASHHIASNTRPDGTITHINSSVPSEPFTNRHAHPHPIPPSNTNPPAYSYLMPPSNISTDHHSTSAAVARPPVHVDARPNVSTHVNSTAFLEVPTSDQSVRPSAPSNLGTDHRPNVRTPVHPTTQDGVPVNTVTRAEVSTHIASSSSAPFELPTDQCASVPVSARQPPVFASAVQRPTQLDVQPQTQYHVRFQDMKGEQMNAIYVFINGVTVWVGNADAEDQLDTGTDQEFDSGTGDDGSKKVRQT